MMDTAEPIGTVRMAFRLIEETTPKGMNMPEISLNNIHKYYGAVHVLKGLSLDVPDGAKIGIVGGNGSGKTTLFRVLSGQETFEKDKGSLHVARNRRIGLLDQLPQHPEGTRVRDVLQSSFGDLLRLKERLEELALHLTDGEEQIRRFGTLQSDFEHRGGYEMEHRFNRVAHGLNISQEMLEQPFSSLSGGEKTRVSLGQIILRETDILLLDEPTNHLDIGSVEWLEEFLGDYAGTVLMISHDRYFLDQVASHIFEIEDGKGQLFPGNYSAYSALKELHRIEALARFESEQKKIRQLETAAKRLHEWANRKDSQKLHSAAFNIEKRIEKMQQEGTEKPKTEKEMKNRFREEVYRGDEVLAVDHLVKRFGDRHILDGVGFVLYGGDRMVLLGPNGCGKTTLLRTLLSELPPEEGSVRIGPSIKVGYLPQEILFEEPARTVIDTLRYAKSMDVQKARNLLAGFRFTGDSVFKVVSGLSGGEKSRLKLCLLMQEEVNLLILDEPTNHLDLPSREWIEESLDDFGGTILFVSHDRYFIRRFANRVAEMENGCVGTYQLDYAEYRAWKEWRRKRDDEGADVIQGTRTESARERQAGKERQRNIGVAERKCAELEKNIADMETRIAGLDREMAGKATDFLLLRTLTAEKEALNRTLPILYDQWEAAQTALSALTEEGDGT